MIDVCLVVEGSYPQVTGGVSTWADRLVRGLPDLSFAIAHLREGETGSEPAAHVLPENTSLVHVDLDPERYEPEGDSFGRLPQARVYHVACTGSAGILAEAAADEHGAGLLLTEHGLAAREAWWAPHGCKPQLSASGPSGCKPQLGSVHSRPQAQVAAALGRMARTTYARADAITSVCAANTHAQAALGAPVQRLQVVPNGAPIPSPRRGRDDAGRPFRAGFIGRVVAIKDVETFLRACALAAVDLPDAEFVVAGPLHHEPAYAERCQALASRLGLDRRLTFTGESDSAALYERLDAVVLTSLSEAQPLVALEAMAAGVPVIATDVGGCAETIVGGGLLTPVRAPRSTADALLRLALDPMLRRRLGATGRRRVTQRHRPEVVHGAYRALYERLAA